MEILAVVSAEQAACHMIAEICGLGGASDQERRNLSERFRAVPPDEQLGLLAQLSAIMDAAHHQTVAAKTLGVN